MNTLTIRKAEKRKAKLRLGLAGPAGYGKTYSAILVAQGLGKKILLIDTENGSGDLYANLGNYDVITLQAPFEPKKYIEAIKLGEANGYDTIIVDSLSHAWAGDGGLLDMKDKIDQRGGNSFANWRMVTPQHNALVEAMLQSKCHIIATMRSKTEYVITEDKNGKKAPQKIGLAPIQREGMDYEFTVMIDIAKDHSGAASKDRTSLLDGSILKLDKGFGEKLLAWLEDGSDMISNNQKSEEMIEKQKQEIAKLLKVLNNSNPFLTKEDYEREAKASTQLDLIPENYDEIIGRLSILIQERKQNNG